MLMTVGFDDGGVDQAPVSPDSLPLDLSPNMDDTSTRGTGVLMMPKADPDPDPDPERSADREAVALAMVMDLTKATGIVPRVQADSMETSEERSQARKKQRKRPREDEKVCRVCGDKALAHNFDAITCESCKAFFRRNALRAGRNTCLFKGECPITVQTRRFCPPCRLQKCFSVGMKADLILDDSERKARMVKVSENRAKRLSRDPDNSGDSQVGSSSQAYIVMNPAAEDHAGKSPSPANSTMTSATYFAHKHQDAEDSTYYQLQHQPKPPLHQQHLLSRGTSEPSGMTTLHYVLTSAPAVSATSSQPVLEVSTADYQQRTVTSSQLYPCTSSQESKLQQSPLQSILQSQRQIFTSPDISKASSKPTQPDFQHIPRDVLPSDPHMYWRLSEEEKTLLTQLSSAYQDTIMTLPERVPCDSLTGEPTAVRSLESIFETSEKNMRQLIDFVQRLGDFDLLREDDKIAVLQASGMRSVILRWTSLYVVERNTWLTRFGECDVHTTSIIFGHEDIIRELATFCRTTKIILKNDITLFVLMHCLILFDPREQHIVDRQLINTFRDKYIILLKHYLESEYSFLYTERYLRSILDKTVEIRHVADKSIGILREFREFVPPLVKQVLNLQENT